jgi:formate-dependent phosphoribosylglycinamide formyltransferase (GAR transformylase)
MPSLAVLSPLCHSFLHLAGLMPSVYPERLEHQFSYNEVLPGCSAIGAPVAHMPGRSSSGAQKGSKVNADEFVSLMSRALAQTGSRQQSVGSTLDSQVREELLFTLKVTVLCYYYYATTWCTPVCLKSIHGAPQN